MPSTASTSKPVFILDKAAPSRACAMIFLRIDKPMSKAITLNTKGTAATQGLATSMMTAANNKAMGKSIKVNKVLAV